SPRFAWFLRNGTDFDGTLTSSFIKNYLMMDDNDIFQSIKCWTDSDDAILSDLCKRFRSRKLFRTTFFDDKPNDALIQEVVTQTANCLAQNGLPSDKKSTSFYYASGENYSEAYKYEEEE